MDDANRPVKSFNNRGLTKITIRFVKINIQIRIRFKNRIILLSKKLSTHQILNII